MSNLKFCQETLMVEDLLKKTADSSIYESLKSYFAEKIVPGHELESVINILTPGIFAAFGFGKVGILIKVAEMLGFNPGKMLTDAFTIIKPSIQNGQQISSDAIDSAVEASVKSNYGSDPVETNEENQQKISSADIRMMKLALISFETKAGVGSALLKMIGLRSKTSSVLALVIGWFIKAVLYAGGFMVAGSVVNKVLNREDKTVGKTPAVLNNILPTAHSTQNLFKVNPNYFNESFNADSNWMEDVSPSQIGDRISNWAEYIYPDLKGKSNFIKSSPAFQNIVSKIQDANVNSADMTFMPKGLTSRKKVVDLFIDDLANKAASLPSNENNSNKNQNNAA